MGFINDVAPRRNQTRPCEARPYRTGGIKHAAPNDVSQQTMFTKPEANA